MCNEHKFNRAMDAAAVTPPTIDELRAAADRAVGEEATAQRAYHEAAERRRAASIAFDRAMRSRPKRWVLVQGDAHLQSAALVWKDGRHWPQFVWGDNGYKFCTEEAADAMRELFVSLSPNADTHVMELTA